MELLFSHITADEVVGTLHMPIDLGPELEDDLIMPSPHGRSHPRRNRIELVEPDRPLVRTTLGNRAAGSDVSPETRSVDPPG